MLKVKWQKGGQRVRYINLRRSRKRSNRALFGKFVTNVHANGLDDISISGTRTIDDAAKLLLKEIEESGNWARIGFQVYFGWFALQFTVNAVAVGWLVGQNSPQPWLFNLACLLLMAWNLLGGIMTVLVYKALAGKDERTVEVLGVLNRHYRTSDLNTESKSPMPRSSFKVIFAFCAVTMFVSFFFWLFVLIGGK
jgi:hypothetical protein